jgi:hypothetical protein
MKSSGVLKFTKLPGRHREGDGAMKAGRRAGDPDEIVCAPIPRD